jgi:hypothetical protein
MDKELKALKQTQSQISKSYKNAQKLYDTQAKELQQLQPQYEQSLIQSYETQRPILQQQFQTGMENIGLQKEQTKGQRESALSTARKQYEQGLQKAQQTFGGVAGSSAGMATADILGAEQLRQTGQVQTQSAQNLMQLGTAERDLQANLTNSLQQLEVKKQQDLMKLRDSFRQELNQINAQKGALSLNKANAQLQALQDYNTRRRQLDDMVTQQRMNLETYAQQLALQARYTSNASINANLKAPSLDTLTTLPANRLLDSLKTFSTSTDQKWRTALQESGWNKFPLAGGPSFWVNENTGRTIDTSGQEYVKNALAIYNAQKADEKDLESLKLK